MTTAEPEQEEFGGYTEFGWMIDGCPMMVWQEGEEPRSALAKYEPVLVRREVGPWKRSDDPRFKPVDRVEV